MLTVRPSTGNEWPGLAGPSQHTICWGRQCPQIHITARKPLESPLSTLLGGADIWLKLMQAQTSPGQTPTKVKS